VNPALSPQARWYLRGSFPCDNGEPSAMESLERAGLVRKVERPFQKPAYALTREGRIARGECGCCGKAGAHWGWCAEKDACPATLRTGVVPT